jgi:hypothetical protein
MSVAENTMKHPKRLDIYMGRFCRNEQIAIYCKFVRAIKLAMCADKSYAPKSFWKLKT